MSTKQPPPFSPAAERNRTAICAQLQRLLPANTAEQPGLVLEIASGTGQHAAHFASQLPAWRWLPSDGQAAALPGIHAWCQDLPNVMPPVWIDVMTPVWSGVPTPVDAMYCANMLHIAPWPACAALMAGTARHLRRGGLLLLYGPFWVEGQEPAPSNLAFDADLRRRDPAWGVRRMADVLHQARAHGLQLQEQVSMPANNLLLVLVHQGRG
ncbi:MAG: DUF938 domain-containing protein [Rubrivivax sp.]|nr:DUF938 domain-containing protein [Rubrivivax sp.]